MTDTLLLRAHDRARTAATIAALLGLAAIGFGGFALVLVGLQRLMLVSFAAASHDGPDASMLAVFDALHGLWLVHMPLGMVVGALLLATGIAVHRGAVAARWLQLVCLIASVELCAYVVHMVLGVLPIFTGTMGAAFELPMRVLGGAGALMVLASAIPLVLVSQAVSGVDRIPRARAART